MYIRLGFLLGQLWASIWGLLLVQLHFSLSRIPFRALQP